MDGGKISAGGGAGYSRTIKHNIVVGEGENVIQNNMNKNNNSFVQINGALSGSGTLSMIDSTSNNGTKGIYLNGDNSSFAGVFNFETKCPSYTVSTSGNYNYSGFKNANAGSANAVWNVTEGSKFLGIYGGGTYHLGALNIPSGMDTGVAIGTAGTVVNIGYKADSSILSSFVNAQATLAKVGATTTLSLGPAFSMVSGSTINVNEGTLVAGSGLALTGVNVTFADGTKMVADAAEGDEASTSDIDLFTTTGTVTLNGTQVVTVTGSTADGSWILKTRSVTEEDVTTTTVYAQFCTPIKVGDDEVGYVDGTTAVVTHTAEMVTLPASGVTAVKVGIDSASGTAVLTSTGLELATANVSVFATDGNGNMTAMDITGAFKVTAGANDTYTIELDGSATVGGVKVAPEIDDAAETPFAVSAWETGLTIKTIPGLWYGIAVSDAAGGTYYVGEGDGAVRQATGANLMLSADFDSGSTLQFFRVKAGASKAAIDAAKKLIGQ